MPDSSGTISNITIAEAFLNSFQPLAPETAQQGRSSVEKCGAGEGVSNLDPTLAKAGGRVSG